jgi:hypothetical protein
LGKKKRQCFLYIIVDLKQFKVIFYPLLDSTTGETMTIVGSLDTDLLKQFAPVSGQLVNVLVEEPETGETPETEVKVSKDKNDTDSGKKDSEGKIYKFFVRNIMILEGKKNTE